MVTIAVYQLGGSCAVDAEAREGVKRREVTTGLRVLERHPLSLALLLNVVGWDVVASWRKSCLCGSRALLFVRNSFFAGLAFTQPLW